MQTAYWCLLALYGFSHTGPRVAGLFSLDLRLSENRRAGGAFEKAYEVKNQA